MYNKTPLPVSPSPSTFQLLSVIHWCSHVVNNCILTCNLKEIFAASSVVDSKGWKGRNNCIFGPQLCHGDVFQKLLNIVRMCVYYIIILWNLLSCLAYNPIHGVPSTHSILELKSPFSGCPAWSLGPWSYRLGISLSISLGLEAVYGPVSNSRGHFGSNNT